MHHGHYRHLGIQEFRISIHPIQFYMNMAIQHQLTFVCYCIYHGHCTFYLILHLGKLRFRMLNQRNLVYMHICYLYGLGFFCRHLDRYMHLGNQEQLGSLSR
jgi:hypothetical protein